MIYYGSPIAGLIPLSGHTITHMTEREDKEIKGTHCLFSLMMYGIHFFNFKTRKASLHYDYRG